MAVLIGARPNKRQEDHRERNGNRWELTCSLDEYEAQSSQTNWLQVLQRWYCSLNVIDFLQILQFPIGWPSLRMPPTPGPAPVRSGSVDEEQPLAAPLWRCAKLMAEEPGLERGVAERAEIEAAKALDW